MFTAITAAPPQPRSAAGPAPDRRRVSVAAGQGVQDVAAAEWDRLLVPGQGALSHGYLRAWQKVGLHGLRCRPLIAREGHDGRAVAAAPGWLYEIDPWCLNSDSRPPRVLERLRHLRRGLLMLRVYELGGPAAIAHPFLCAAGLPPDEAAGLLLGEAVAEGRRSGAQVILVQDFPDHAGPCDAALAAAGFSRVPILPAVVLELGFDSFDGYLQAMRAPYRRRARLVLQRSEGVTVERRDHFEELAPQLAAFSLLMFERASEARREILTEEYFRAASASDDLSLLVLRRDDGSIASWALLMDDGPCLQFLNCGFEESAGRNEGAYFRLLYEIVRAGIAGGHERINLGVTTVPPKLDIGGVPVALSAWMRYRHRPVHRACAAAAARFMHAELPAARAVFHDPARRTLSPAVTRWPRHAVAAGSIRT